MDEAAIQRIIQKNNEQLLAQMSSLISTTLQGLKRSNEDQAQEQLQEIKKLKYADVPSFNSLATGPVKTSPILEYYFQVFCKFYIFGSVHAM